MCKGALTGTAGSVGEMGSRKVETLLEGSVGHGSRQH